jgi:hypothetical protein
MSDDSRPLWRTPARFEVSSGGGASGGNAGSPGSRGSGEAGEGSSAAACGTACGTAFAAAAGMEVATAASGDGA